MSDSESRISCFYITQAGSTRQECAGIRTPVLTGLALIAFAANSFLCRGALGQAAIDAAGFTIIRLVSGAMVLWLLTARARRSKSDRSAGSWLSAAMLFSYAVTFSFAYVSLNTGTGALILFGSVQATMFAAALLRSERPGLPEYIGLIVALGGLTYLVFPGLKAPSPRGALLMALAGISWGIYSLRGRGATDPIAATRDNFLRAAVLVLPIGIIFFPSLQVSFRGIVLAVVSGGLTSAIGYVIWYAALQDLRAVQAALAQLLVPVLAAIGGVVLLSETLSFRLVVAAALILGGIAFAIAYPVYVSKGKA